jgi:hypothetical protein
MFFKRKAAGLILAAAAAAGLTTAAALPARASTNFFAISLQKTFLAFLCIQPADPAGGAGTAIVQHPCSNSNLAQQWAPVNMGGTTYEFVNRVTGFCLNVAGGAARGTPITQLPCSGVSNERWTWTAGIPAARNPLQSQVSGSGGFCLTEPGASSQDGLAMQLDTCNGSSGQIWDITGPASS